MKKLVVIAAIVLAGHAAAASLVAMRVETVVGGYQDDLGIVELTIQVAPEDRTRIGDAVWISGELRRGDELTQRLDERTRMSSDGVIRSTLTAPPGSYQLRVDIEGLTTGATGFWKGRVLVPTPPPPPSPATSSELSPPAPESPPAAAAAPTSTSAAATPRDAPPAPNVAVSETEAQSPADTRRGDSAPSASTGTTAASGAIPSDIAAPTPTDAAEAATDAQPPTAAPTSEATQPGIAALSPAPTAAPAPTVTMAPGLAVVTVLVTDSQNTPISGLERADFKVEVAGRPVAVEGFAGSRSPLLLGLAVDLSSTMAELLPELRPLIGQLAERQLARGGDSFLVTATEQIELAVAPGSPPGSVMTALAGVGTVESHNLASLVVRALKEFEGHRGRAALILLSDGGDTASRDDWKSAHAAAAAAGVPVLVSIFDSSALGGRTLGRLRKTAAVSGGKDYLLQGTHVLRLTLEHFEELVNDGVALAFAAPSGRTEPLRIGTESGATVFHSEAITGP